MNAKSIKPIAALALTAAGSALVVGFRTPEAGLPAATAGTNPTSASTATTTGSNSPSATAGSGSGSGTATPTAGAGASSTSGAALNGSGSVASAGPYADGTFLGASVSEPWGAFQVQVVISDGRITAVTVVASPRDRRSTSINSSAVPRLTAAAIAKQSADVDLISGATWTARSYRTSLQAALDQAAAKKAA